MLIIIGVILLIIVVLLVRPGTHATPAAEPDCVDCGGEAATAFHYNGDPICADCGASRWMRGQR